MLKALGLTWDALAAIEPRRFGGWRMWKLRREARRYLRSRFAHKPLWGLNNSRAIRLLPFWLRVLREANVDDAYLLAIRNPASVAASLHARQKMDAETAQRLWLVNVVPFLGELDGKLLSVVDYDLLVRDPRGQLDASRGGFGYPETNAPRSSVLPASFSTPACATRSSRSTRSARARRPGV